MTKKRTRIFTFLLTLILLFSFCATALALTVTDHDLYDHFEYYRDGVWQDLNTVMYSDAWTGNIGYCIEHEAKPPRESLDYVPYDPYTMFTGYTMTGIQAILNHGYPASNNGFSADDAFYATANALRFWIKESCGQGYDFMYLPHGSVRAKSGGVAVWNWCMELLNYARSQDTGGNASVYVSPSSPKWTLNNGQLTTTISVSSSYGYSVTPSNSNISISGYTGGRSDTLTVTAPASLIGTDVSLYFTATAGSVSTVDLGFYEPYASERQKLVFVEMISGSTGQSRTISITGEFYDLTVYKTDAATGAALDGATFQLTANGSAVGLTQTAAGRYSAGGSTTQFSASGGTAVLSGLPAGSYQLVEVSAPTAYIASAAKSITLNSHSSVTVANAPTALTITKTNTLTGEPMSGVTFTLLDSGGNPVALTQTGDGIYTAGGSNTTFTTGSGGKAVISYLPMNAYTLRESPMDGFVTLSDVAVSFTGANSVSIKNQPTALQFTKTDSVTGEPLDGGVFQIKDGSGAVINLTRISEGVYKKDAAGEATFTTSGGVATIYGLSVGIPFTVTEISAPAGYTKDADKTVTVSAGNSASSPATVTMADSPMALRFTKTDALTNSPIDGAAFSLYESDGETLIKLRRIEDGVYTPDADGGSTFTTQNGSALIAPLSANSYVISEEQAATGFTVAADVAATVTEASSSTNPATATMSDAPLALIVKKMDSISKAPIGGATFRLFDGKGNAIKVSPVAGREGWYGVDENGTADFTLPASGSATIVYVPQGGVEVKEVSAAPGYALPAGTVTAAVGTYNTYTSPATVTVENEPLAVLLEKVDASDKSPLANVVFQIKDANGAFLRFALQEDGSYHVTADGEDHFKTDSAGKAVILYIPAGEYTLMEQQHPGFAPTDGQTFTVTVENTVDYPAKIGVENWPLYLAITKTDKLSGTVMANVSFKLMDSAGEALHFTLQEDGRYKVTSSGSDVFKTDAEGKAWISHIPAGTYSLVEQAFDGYGLLAPVSITVESDNTEEAPATSEVANCPTEFVLTKVDAETKATLAGVIFTLKDAQGQTVSLARMKDGTYRPLPAVTDAEDVQQNTDTITTNSAGKVVIQYLRYGKYTLEERQMGGYAPLTGIAFEITSAHSTEAPLTLTVENIPASLIVKKTDAVTKAPLSGTRFTLKDASGKVIKLIREQDGSYRPARSGETGLDELTVGSDGTATVRYITGKVTVHESGAPVGFAYAADKTVEVGMTAIAAVGGDKTKTVTSVSVEDLPLMLKISKIHAKTLKPLKGAAFQIMVDGSTTPLTFVLRDGVYWYSKSGDAPAGASAEASPAEAKVTTITMDSNAQAYVCGLPAAKYRLVESVVPSGFFPAPAQDFTLLLTHTSEKPLEVTVTNTPEVKLGLDSDKWDDVLLIGGGVLLAAGAAFFLLRRRKRRIAR